MASDSIFENASPLGQRFRALFLQQLAYLPYAEEFTDRYELSIPAAHPEVGELRVRDDADELTISVGPHHWHISLYMFDAEPEERRIELAAGTAVDDLRRFVEGRTVLRVEHRNGQVRSTMSYDPDSAAVELPTENETEYLWTGPRTPPK
jgi:hypothetical protein